MEASISVHAQGQEGNRLQMMGHCKSAVLESWCLPLCGEAGVPTQHKTDWFGHCPSIRWHAWCAISGGRRPRGGQKVTQSPSNPRTCHRMVGSRARARHWTSGMSGGRSVGRSERRERERRSSDRVDRDDDSEDTEDPDD